MNRLLERAFAVGILGIAVAAIYGALNTPAHRSSSSPAAVAQTEIKIHYDSCSLTDLSDYTATIFSDPRVVRCRDEHQNIGDFLHKDGDWPCSLVETDGILQRGNCPRSVFEQYREAHSNGT